MIKTNWSAAELEMLAGYVQSQDQGVLQYQWNKRAGDALLDFARQINDSRTQEPKK